MEQKRSVLQAELIVVSDIHLRQEGDDRHQLLMSLGEQILSGDVGHFVLLGDIFDFCLGSNRHFKTKFSAIGNLLTRISQKGTRVLFFEGNHEFDLDKIGWPGVEIIPEGNFQIKLTQGLNIKMAHGDLVYSKWSYRWFRWFLKSPVVLFIARHVPGKWLDDYALFHARASRASDRYRTLDHEELLGDANRWLNSGDATDGIFGHFHVPYAEPSESQRGLILSVDSWDKPNFLACVDGKFERWFYEKAAKEWQRFELSERSFINDSV
jgi:UDP-2,3-diacylglucosamine hydrolase